MRRAIIWDYDGTLVDSWRNNFLAYDAICEEFGIQKFYSSETLRQWYDSDYRNNYRRMGIPKSQVPRAIEIYGKTTLGLEARLHQGMGEFVRQLGKQYKQAVVSGNLRAEIEQKLGKAGVLGCFETIVPWMPDCHKPDPKQFLIAMEQLGIAPAETCAIGDMAKDVLGARNAGIREIVAVSYGWQTPKQLSDELALLKVQPDKIVHSPEELRRYFEGSKH
ncbi:HAD-IA family hydrolase [Candidatus Woesearchaeota archaeon]|nr:HAD-IA family hydrolase [Candidatus Woesearchaeota archaeon]